MSVSQRIYWPDSVFSACSRPEEGGGIKRLVRVDDGTDTRIIMGLDRNQKYAGLEVRD